jgi:polyferredoxin
MLAVAGLMAFKLATRADLFVNVLHDRNPLAVTLSDGGVRNAYTVRVLNKRPENRAVDLLVSGAPDLRLQIVDASGGPSVTVGPDQTLELRVLVIAPPGAVPDQPADIVFTVQDASGATTAAHSDHFFPK